MRRRKVVIGAAFSALLSSAGVAAVALGGSASAATGLTVAPYVDLSADSASMLNPAISQAGLKSYTAAFVIGSGCTPIWGDTLGIDNSTVNAKIAAAKAAGASAIISFGGAGGVELAQSCTDQGALTAAYQSVLTKYGVDHLDFDVEGAAIADQGSVTRRYQAIKTLEANNPGLNVSVTIPVLPDGPDGNGSAFLRAAATNGVRLDVVNAMTMDYGRPVADMAGAAQTAAAGTLNAAKAGGLNVSYANIGITPMIGNNDTPGDVVTQQAAQSIVDWARGNGIGRLAFWSIGRDQPCAGGGVSPNCSGLGGAALDFTRIFTAAASGGTPPAPPTQPTQPQPTQPPTTQPPTTQPPAPPTQPTDPTQPTQPTPPTQPTTVPTQPGQPPAGATPWEPNHAYQVGQLVTYNGVTYKCWQAHTSLVTWEPPNTPALWIRQ
jgi:chitinase